MRSLGGSDDESNLVKLTAREHFIAHLLLAKFNKCSQTAYALWMMQCKSSKHDSRPFIKSSRMYEWARKEFAKYISRNNKIASKGERNSQYGTRWICNIELKENKKILKSENVPTEWVLGRNKWNINKASKESRETICISCKNKFIVVNKYRKFCSDICREKSDSCKILKGRSHSAETRKKLSENSFAARDPERQRKHAVYAASYQKTSEQKEKLRQISMNNKSGYSNKGLKRAKIKCPHCSKVGAKNVMIRFHFNNCSSI